MWTNPLAEAWQRNQHDFPELLITFRLAQAFGWTREYIAELPDGERNALYVAQETIRLNDNRQLGILIAEQLAKVLGAMFRAARG